jgi:hypothetical protein
MNTNCNSDHLIISNKRPFLLSLLRYVASGLFVLCLCTSAEASMVGRWKSCSGLVGETVLGIQHDHLSSDQPVTVPKRVRRKNGDF